MGGGDANIGGGDMGGMAGGGLGVDITGDLDPSTLATAQAEGAGGRQASMQTQVFLSDLIEYIEIKTGY
jgi:hypothetical protein